MRPIPATRLGDAHGLLRAIESRGRLRTDEFVTEFNLDELFPPGLENALGRLRHFISFGRLAGLVKEDRGVVELTDVGKRYVRSEDAAAPFDVSSQQAEWLRRLLRERHMTDSIYHGLAIGLSLLASVPPGTRISTMDFGRSMAYLGRAGWDNENTLLIQGERHLTLLTDLELIDGDHRLSPTGEQLRGELTLPVHMSLVDIAAQLNPGGAAAVTAAAEAEFAAPAPEPTVEAPEPEPPTVEEPPPAPADDGGGYHTVISSAAGGADAGVARPPIVPAPRVTDETPTPPSTDRPPATSDPLLPFAGTPTAMPGLTPGDPLASPPPAVVAGDAVPPQDTGPTSWPPPAARDAASSAPPPAAGNVAPPVSSAPPAGGVAPPVSPAPPVAGGDVASPARPVASDDVVAPVSSAPPVGGDVASPARPAAGGDVVAPVSSAPPAAEHVAPSISPAPPVGGEVAPPVRPAAGDDVVAPVSAPAGDVAPPVSPAPPVAPPVSSAPPASAAPPAVEPVAPPVSPAPPVGGGDVTPPARPGAGGDIVPPAPATGEVAAPVSSAPVAAGHVAPPVSPVPHVGTTPAPAAGAPAFVDVATIRAAALAAGLRLPAGVYAGIAAALSTGKHLLFVGAPGSGKTELALAVARAAAQEGKARGATVVTGDPRPHIIEAASQGRWVLADELDGADFETTLAPLSTFLGGVPVTFPDGEATPAEDWRLLATWNGATPPRAAILRRFALITVHPPAADELSAAIRHAANHDATATAATEKLAHYKDRVGTGVLLDAAKHAAARQAATPTDPDTLAHELIAAYIAPLIEP